MWYLVNVSAKGGDPRGASQGMLNMSTLSTNDQGKSFRELVYVSVSQVLADHRPAVLYYVVHFRFLSKEYLTLV